MTQLELINVYKRYSSGNEVVKDFSLQIEQGEFVVFVGPSGCGKSTTLRMIAGLEEISSGQLWMNGQFMNFVEAKDRQLSMVFQNYALYPHMTVYNNMAFGAKVHKIPKQEMDRRVCEVAEILGISHLLKSYPKALSGGQKQRVAIGSVMVLEPSLFLMDEPLSNLDAKLRNQMRIELAKIHQRRKATFIYVTHDQVEAMTLGTKIVVMQEGVIQQVGSPEEIYHHPKNQFVAGFMGNPTMNFIPVRLAEEENNLVATFALGRLPIPEIHSKALVKRGYVNKEVNLGFRSGHLVYTQEARKQLVISGYLPCVTRHSENLGADQLVYTQMGEEEIAVKMPVSETVNRGEKLDLYLDMNRVHWFDAGTGESILYEGGMYDA